MYTPMAARTGTESSLLEWCSEEEDAEALPPKPAWRRDMSVNWSSSRGSSKIQKKKKTKTDPKKGGGAAVAHQTRSKSKEEMESFRGRELRA
jgi:hypothetical protein